MMVIEGCLRLRDRSDGGASVDHVYCLQVAIEKYSSGERDFELTRSCTPPGRLE